MIQASRLRQGLASRLLQELRVEQRQCWVLLGYSCMTISLQPMSTHAHSSPSVTHGSGTSSMQPGRRGQCTIGSSSSSNSSRRRLQIPANLETPPQSPACVVCVAALKACRIVGTLLPCLRWKHIPEAGFEPMLLHCFAVAPCYYYTHPAGDALRVTPDTPDFVIASLLRTESLFCC